MTIYILQVPHQMPPKAWTAETIAEALCLLSTDYEEFDDLSEAVAHDMHAGFWAESIADLKDAVGWLQHQRLKSNAAIISLA